VLKDSKATFQEIKDGRAKVVIKGIKETREIKEIKVGKDLKALRDSKTP
jgi:hypothetical protein